MNTDASASTMLKEKEGLYPPLYTTIFSEFWVKTDLVNGSLYVSLGKGGLESYPSLEHTIDGWGGTPVNHVSFTHWETPITFQKLNSGEEPSCPGESIFISSQTILGLDLYGENEDAATEPVVLGEECEEGVVGRYVLLQRDTQGAHGDFSFNFIMVNHTENGG